MRHKIERARSGRSRCKECGQPIARDELRLGVGHAQEGGTFSHRWYHLDCGTVERFQELEEALAAASLPIPDRAALEAKIDAGKAGLPQRTYPCAEGGNPDPYHCAHCGGWSFPNALRVLTPTTVQIGGTSLPRTAPLHPGCAEDYLGQTGLLQTLLDNSPGLALSDIEWLKESFP